jgi:anhydro-N-acetylmuramic acid kinase
MATTYSVIGLMSGTSLDGIDIAFCTFSNKVNKWTYKIVAAETITYDRQWQQCLQDAEKTTALEFVLTDTEYGHHLGKLVRSFIKKHRKKPELVASHGHTIFHQPQKGFTTQIGNGAAIAAECGLPVVCDFRSKDVALGGQGAPLVPIGDELLFSKYSFCLNLGGFANVSFNNRKKRVAYDICPVNIVLNALSQKLGKKYDAGGALAHRGKINQSLLKQLNSLPYYKQKYPKSLGKEWVIATIFPLLKKSGANPFDLLRTFTEHAAMQVGQSSSKFEVRGSKINSILITGGGAYNTFLIERIKAYCDNTIIIPDKNTIEFKEALIFAFLGVLRLRGEVNCLSSVTGADNDNVGGCIYL